MYIPLTRIQKLVGQRMLQSKLSKPCFYIESKADVSELMALRPKLTKSLGIRITSSAFVIRALALAAKRFPTMIGTPVSNPGHSPAADALARRPPEINVAFPVHAPQGLVVPVIKNADKKPLGEIARLEKLLTDKARSNKLTLEEMEGQTIGLSNLGPYGVDSFFGIVPPVASAILAVGNVIRTVVCEARPAAARDSQMSPALGIADKGGVSIRRLITLGVTVDGRTADETYAAEFLGCIIEQLQEPQRLL